MWTLRRLLGNLGQGGLRQEQDTGDADRVFQGRAHDLRRVDDARFEQVDVSRAASWPCSPGRDRGASRDRVPERLEPLERNFRVDRVSELAVLEERFELLSPCTLADYVAAMQSEL